MFDNLIAVDSAWIPMPLAPRWPMRRSTTSGPENKGRRSTTREGRGPNAAAYSPLHRASAGGNVAVAKMLIAKGAALER